MKSVESINPCQTLPVRQAGVVQTIYEIVKAHDGELKVETKEARPDYPVGRGEGSEFIIQFPLI
jgi:hypothetical protein